MDTDLLLAATAVTEW